jgi:transcriptional antiterminator NusG
MANKDQTTKKEDQKASKEADTETKQTSQTTKDDSQPDSLKASEQPENENEQVETPEVQNEKIEAPEVQEVEVEEPNIIRIADEDDERARWYVVHTYSGREVKVAEALKQRAQTLNLDDQIIKILIPTKEKIQIRKGKRKNVKEKIFPGYMLVNMIMSDEAWLAVRTTQGVTGFVGASSKPTPIATHEVEAILKYSQQATPQYKAEFVEGQAVKITDGPFTEFLGTVQAIDESKGQVEVLISIFGRETPVELDFLQVEKV